jgi:lipopolysaccharide transport system ATP-binding protein
MVLNEGRVYFQGTIAQATNTYQALLFGKPRQDEKAGSPNDLPDAAHPSCPSISEQNPSQDHQPDKQPAIRILMQSGNIDNCRNRPSYNKHETRLGDGRMQILDYIIAIPGEIEPAHIPHDAEIEIYVKFHFFENLDNVSIGFAFISKDSLYVYGTNLSMQCKPLLSGRAGETLIAKMVCNPTLVGGDYFLNLGCNRITPQQEDYLDVRRSIAHLKVNDTPWCTGFLAAESTLEVMERFVH